MHMSFKIWLMIALVALAAVVMVNANAYAPDDDGGDDDGGSGYQEPSDSKVASFAAAFMEEYIKDKFPQYSITTAAFLGTVFEYDAAWDCGSDHWWQVIGNMSINKFESHYYHISLGYVGGEWEVAKISICPSSYYPNFEWNELYRSEYQMIKIGWLWPETSPLSEFITMQDLEDQGYNIYATQAFADANHTQFLGYVVLIETPAGKSWTLQYIPDEFMHGYEYDLEVWWSDGEKMHSKGDNVRIIEHGLGIKEKFYLHEQDLRDAGIIP